MPKSETVNEQFPLSTCRTLRTIVGLRKKVRADRDRAFENRDDARDRMDEAEGDKQKRDAEADFGLCVRQIERLQTAIKKLDNDIEEAIENPDQEELFDVGQLTLRDYVNDTPSKIATKVKEKQDAKKAADAEAPPEGVDQHLAASINELDLTDRLKEALLEHNIPTVGALVVFQDKSDTDNDADDLQDLLNVEEKDQKAIISALAKYRREHRKAARQVEGAAA